MRLFNHILIFLVSLFLISIKAGAQQLNVVFKDKTAYISVKVIDSIGRIDLDKLPETIVLDFPDEDYQNFTLKFNEDSASRFEVGFNCSEKNCVKLQLGDVVNSKIKLVFSNGELVAINTRYVKPQKVILADKSKKAINPFIVINGPEKKTEKKGDGKVGFYDALKVNTDSTPQKTFTPDIDLIKSYKYYCVNLECRDCKEDEKPGKRDFIFEAENNYDLFGKVFEKNSNFYKKLLENKVTPKYWVVYDNREGKSVIPYYFKINNYKSGTDNKFITTQVSIAPRARKHVVYSILGSKDSAYIIDNNPAQYFIEDETKFAAVLNGIKTSPSDSPKVTDKKKGADSQFNNETGNEPESFQMTGELTNAEIKQLESIKSPLKALDFVRKNIPGSKNNPFYNAIGENIKSIQKVNSDKSVNTDSIPEENITALIINYTKALNSISMLRKKNESLLKSISELRSKDKKNTAKIKSLNNELKQKSGEIDVLKKELADYKKKATDFAAIIDALPATKDLFEKLYALERDLEKFNAGYYDYSFLESQYRADLLCLQLKIKSFLNITSVNSADNLSAALVERVKSDKTGSMFYIQIGRLIKDIEVTYKSILDKKPKYSIFSVAKKTPNTDEFVTSLKTKNVPAAFFTDTFKTSFGLKIDFSTGIFINGLSNPEFVLSQHSFRYRESKDSVVVREGNPKDTIIYTGQVLNTSGNLIHINEPKFSYSAGFLLHVYTRTGLFTNIGGVTGITINNSNSSPIQLMLGGSIMFNSGKSSRVSLVGGCTWGQVRELSSVAKSYLWNESVDPDNRLYNSAHEAPAFFTGSSDLPTFTKWKSSWFFGVTYNFASLNVGGQ